VPDPDRWRAAERRRRRLAERLARELAHPDPDAPPGAMSNFVAGTVVRVRWASAFEAQIAFDQAPSLIAFGAEFGRVEGGGVVLVVHCIQDSMDDWSLVVPYEPFAAPVLVCVDDMAEHCMGIYGDSPEARDALSTLHVRLIGAFGNRRDAIARGSLPPD
jgi:hypothetical protein